MSFAFKNRGKFRLWLRLQYNIVNNIDCLSGVSNTFCIQDRVIKLSEFHNRNQVQH